MYQELENRARNVLILQAAGTVAVALGFTLWIGLLAGAAAVFGGGIGIASTLILRHGVKKAAIAAAADPGAGMRVLYIGAAQRFFLVLALFAIAIAILKLDPLALFCGFALAQAAYFFGARQVKKKQNGS